MLNTGLLLEAVVGKSPYTFWARTLGLFSGDISSYSRAMQRNQDEAVTAPYNTVRSRGSPRLSDVRDEECPYQTNAVLAAGIYRSRQINNRLLNAKSRLESIIDTIE